MSFLKHYGNFVENTEAHKTFHVWCALFAISSLISRRVWIHQGHFILYPNMYIVLVGPAGSRKTTAMAACKGILRCFPEDVPLCAEAITKEALVKDLVANQRAFELEGKPYPYSPITVCVSELSQFMGTGADRMADFLTAIYDEDRYEYKVKNAPEGGSKRDVVDGPFMNLLAGTVPSWITTYLKGNIITSGFARRTMFVYEFADSEPIPFPEVSDFALSEKMKCVEWGRQLLKVKGEFKWEPDAREWYGDWYINHRKNLNRSVQDPNSTGYFESKHAMLLKVAMLVALSESIELKLTKQCLQAALAMLELSEKNLSRVFDGVGRNPLNSSAAFIIDYVDRAGGFVGDKQLQKATFHQVDRAEYSNVMQHLKETERLKAADFDLDGNGTRRYWCTNAGLTSLIERVQQRLKSKPADADPTSA